MPSVGTGARRYAQAVFELARESGRFEEWQKDLQLMAEVFQNRSVELYFLDPKASLREKQEAVRQMFEGRVQPEAFNFVRMLVERQRTGALPRILELYEELGREEAGVVVAEVTTAIPVDAEEREHIGNQLSRMTGKKVQLQTSVNPELIGGMVARIGDKLIDGSVRTALEGLRRSLR